MRDADLPDFLKCCHACGAKIENLEQAPAEGLDKGGGFSSMALFCSNSCADGSVVEASLLNMGDNDGTELDVTGDSIEDDQEGDDVQ